MSVEGRIVCDSCGQFLGGFHKHCDGKWVEQQRTVSDWKTVGPYVEPYTVAEIQRIVALRMREL